MSCGIYKITNNFNQKSYIGQSIDIEECWKKHLNAYKHKENQNWMLYKAFLKYGIDNFSFEIIEECSKDKLDEREIYWISYYHTFMNDPECQGYNMTIGGKDSFIGANDKKVLQYTSKGDFIKSYKSAHEACRQTGVQYTNICKCCRGERPHANNYIWRYENSNLPVVPIKTRIRRRAPVLQINLETNEIITEYPSAAEAARQVPSAYAVGISNCCRGKQQHCGGFKWRLKNDEDMGG